MRWAKDYIKPRNCLQCNQPLSLKQLYRKNKYCSNKCMGIRYTLPDKIARMKAHDLKYRIKNKEYLAKRRKELTEKRKNMVYEILGNVCVKCGFSDKRALQIDHINGNGLKDRNPRITSSKHFYLVVYNSTLNKENKYQILCANCNWIKRYENKENGWDYKLNRNLPHAVNKIL